MTTKQIDYTRPTLYPMQFAAIYDPARYSIIESSTKSGKTAGCIVWLTEQALVHGRPGRNYWWIAPVFAQARIAFRRLKRGLEQGTFTANESELTITLPNSAVIWFKSADNPDALYGEDVHAAVIDEASRCREESWHAVRSTLTATRGSVRIIGNVKGRKNWAYHMARRAESGAPDMAYHRITAYDAVEAGVLDGAEIADAKATLPENVFKELYLAEASDDEGNPFGIDAIRAQVRPLSNLPPAAFGIDLAKKQDWTVILGIDRNGQTCRFERFQMPWQETLDRIEATVGYVPALVDSTGVGDPILEGLQRRGGDNYQGYMFSGPSKQKLMEGLAVAIQQGAFSYPSGPIVLELEAVEYEYTRTGVRYAVPEGMHDDCVMAGGLAVRCLGTMPVLDRAQFASGGVSRSGRVSW